MGRNRSFESSAVDERVAAACATLDVVSARFTEQWPHLRELAGPSSRPTAFKKPGASAAKGARKPVSHAPPGSDVDLRVALVGVARAVAEAHWHLTVWAPPSGVWVPASLGVRSQVATSWLGCPSCRTKAGDKDGDHRSDCAEPESVLRMGWRVAWEPAADEMVFNVRDPWPDAQPGARFVRVPSPAELDGACRWLAGSLGWCQTVDRPSAAWRMALGRSCGAVNRAREALRLVGAWEDPSPPGRRCSRCEWRIPDGRNNVCSTCRQELAAERKKAS